MWLHLSLVSDIACFQCSGGKLGDSNDARAFSHNVLLSLSAWAFSCGAHGVVRVGIIP